MGLLRRNEYREVSLEPGKGADALDRRPELAGAMKHARKLAQVRAAELKGSLEQRPGSPLIEKLPDHNVGTPILGMGRKVARLGHFPVLAGGTMNAHDLPRTVEFAPFFNLIYGAGEPANK
jgi:hypothetical protein